MRNVWRTSSVRLLVLLPFVFLLVAFQATDKEPIGKITYPLNRVYVIRAGSTDLIMATYNMDVFPGDKIETKKESRCEITLKNGDVVRVDENSIYTLENVEVSEKTVRAESFLSVGRIWSNIRKLFSKGDYFKIKSPAAVIAVRGTVYRVNANPDSTTEVYVYEGKVAVSPYRAGVGQQEWQPVSPGEKRQEERRVVAPPRPVQGPKEVSVEEWFEIVMAQQHIRVNPDGTYQKDEFDPQKDAELDWVQWNKQRDALIKR